MIIDKSFVELLSKTLFLLLDSRIDSEIISILYFVVSIFEVHAKSFLFIISDINGQSQESLEVGDLKVALHTATISFNVKPNSLIHEVVEIALVLPLVHVEYLVEIKTK